MGEARRGETGSVVGSPSQSSSSEGYAPNSTGTPFELAAPQMNQADRRSFVSVFTLLVTLICWPSRFLARGHSFLDGFDGFALLIASTIDHSVTSRSCASESFQPQGRSGGAKSP